MANNCLVTKLKVVVDNDSLVKFGEMKIKCSTAACGGTTTEGMRTMRFSVGGLITAGGRTFKVKVSNDAGSYSEVTEWDALATNLENKYIFPDGEYNVSIGDKYSIRGFGTDSSILYSSFFSFNLEDLAYSKDLWYLFGLDKYCVIGELKYVDINNITGIVLSDYSSPQGNISFINIDMLKDCLKLTKITVYRLTSYQGTKSYGNINNLKSPALDTLMINETNITGDINTMIQNMIAAGRTSGRFYTQGNNLITVNGTPYKDFKNSLPGSGNGVYFTIDLSAPNGWTAVKLANAYHAHLLTEWHWGYLD